MLTDQLTPVNFTKDPSHNAKVTVWGTISLDNTYFYEDVTITSNRYFGMLRSFFESNVNDREPFQISKFVFDKTAPELTL